MKHWGHWKRKLLFIWNSDFPGVLYFISQPCSLPCLPGLGSPAQPSALTTVLAWTPLQVETEHSFMAMLSGHCWGHLQRSGPRSHHCVDLLPEHSETLEDPEEQTGPPGLTNPYHALAHARSGQRLQLPSSLALHKLEGTFQGLSTFSQISYQHKYLPQHSINSITFYSVSRSSLICHSHTSSAEDACWAPRMRSFISFPCLLSFYYSYLFWI